MKACPKCKRWQDDEVLTCDCGCSLTESNSVIKSSYSPPDFSGQANKNSSVGVVKKYTSLRTISSYFHLLAWLNLIGAILFAVFMLKNGTVFTACISIIGGLSTFVIISAIGELIMVAIDMEENLRKIISLNEK